MNFDTMTDEQINQEVANILGEQTDDGFIQYPNIGKFEITVIPDFCNNPQYAFPIMLENGIGINKYALKPWHTEYETHKNLWWATHKDIDELEENQKLTAPESKNPLRAAMITFILINKAKDYE